MVHNEEREKSVKQEEEVNIEADTEGGEKWGRKGVYGMRGEKGKKGE